MENNNETITMSRIAFERMQAKDEKNDLWRNVIIVILIFMLVISNGAWLIAWNQYDYSSTQTEIKADDGSNANYIGGNGEIKNGSNDNRKEKDTEKEERE